MYKKIIIGLAVIVACAFIAFSFGSYKGNSTTSEPLTIEQLAEKRNYSIGELNTNYNLIPKNPKNNGTNMSMNFLKVKAEAEKPLSQATLKNVIVITNAGSLALTKEIVGNALFFEFYTEKGRLTAPDIKMYDISTPEGNTEIILHSEKIDLTWYKFLAVGPIENTNGKKVLFEIQPK